MNFFDRPTAVGNPLFDPALLQAATFDDFTKMTPEQLAGKLVVHTMKIKGHDFHVWSQYDQDAQLEQRCMVRSDLWHKQTMET